MSGSKLPTANVEAWVQLRREQAAQARARRVDRERDLARAAAEWLGDDLLDGPIEFREQFTVVAKRERVRAFLQHLRDGLGFDYIVDVTAIDYLKHEEQHHPERFAVLWTLGNLEREAYLRVRTYVDEDDPVCPTSSDLWPGANWPEREVWDMYGIEFSGHPNLVRLLCPEEFSGHPLRKDYPLRGRGERDNFPVIRRDEEGVQ
jgi:NADH-quinone oxidoreductase subunit C